MRTTLPITLILLALTTLWRCGSNDAGQQQEQLLKNEVYAIHDEVMPKMGEVNRLKRQLSKVLKEQTEIAPAVRENIEAAIRHLEKADDDMNSWMNNFTDPAKLRAAKSHDEIMKYLQTEKDRINAVAAEVVSSLEEGTKLLEGFTAQ